MGTHRPSPPRGMSPTPIRTQVRPQTNVKPAQVVDLTRSGPTGPASGPSTVNQAKSRYPALLVHPKPQDGKVHIFRKEYSSFWTLLQVNNHEIVVNFFHISHDLT
jgi:hypothetical protein